MDREAAVRMWREIGLGLPGGGATGRLIEAFAVAVEAAESERWKAEIERLRADCEAFRKDAKHYRWLRDRATTGKAVQLVQWMPGEMDAKVDAAMRATGAGG